MCVYKQYKTTKALGDRCRLIKKHHKDKQGDYNNELCSAMHHTTTKHQSTFCSGSKRLFSLHTDDTSYNNPPPLEIGVFEVECIAKIPTPTRFHTTLFLKVNRREVNGV